jgi:hypothetical protein
MMVVCEMRLGLVFSEILLVLTPTSQVGFHTSSQAGMG